MLKRKLTKLSAVLVSAALASSLLAGCGSSSSSSTSGTEQKVSYNLGADPQTIDPGLNNSVEGGTVIENAFEGLVDINKNEKVVPGVASSWDISADNLTYTFHLRKNAKWSDGKPVKAKDFEFAWKRALAPETASDYAYQLYYLKNGEAYNNGKASKDDVGVKAIDDYTLKVNLEAPTPYFLSLTAFPTYMPLREDIVSKDNKGWAAKKQNYVSNGPFYMTDWKMKATMTFSKNPNYWNKNTIKLNSITYYMLAQESSATAAFTSGQVDINDLIPAVQKSSLIQKGDAKAYPYYGTYFFDINVGDKDSANGAEITKTLKNPKVREALNLAVDRESIVKNVTKGGEKPATSFVPSSIKLPNGKTFKNKDYYPAKGDVKKAKQLLAEAGYPDGKGFPSMQIMYNEGSNNQDVVQALQDMYKKNLNINFTLQSVERKVQLDNLTKQQYQICRASWIADYNDPMTFMDLFVTDSGNNNSGYSNPEYDALIKDAKTTNDADKRIDDMHKAEDAAMRDLPVIPIYEYTNVVEVKPYVKDLHKSPLGFVYFNNTYIKK
ncbi:oligopeptide transport system substrate-binding protein [Clostridium acetobutylicum]|uniref:Oligopeptide ABC transporter, periplasmic substrate-binding component n=1 Tax=Clostridium acetobutylicum (strain ATCC 824 / DSM 792 / JCM 1419 / IAM 19013 / LMG 5710 / NBRC 13948 / NRRL B-527 / VKM B-1787 / 2291 / W) TaxID=272562 RepID=Q97D46_CLOAB|nr:MULTISPECIES: peptide ABC transporter substrate-binding protein [Clostridium]AAK81557.1 Oligopeptide ABC transporter, periplasmic substrate-binding component [Clostridium acetobutylicum ATCC 824]ADZ22678.1 Oligopeptide ABC transporter, periplasmic substrate-binding component [Clostridium acetobutylicum EA 2018]AEI34410.1 oligopeptide ABC transporter, periplasmic substrate-binding component [Clostridium acetobutylicum DSM 1731]AWV80770.1 peptide ABC transporter substrate-binding protein [Clos